MVFEGVEELCCECVEENCEKCVCYYILSVVYFMWMLLLGWVKDYIVVFKFNGY